MCILLLTRGDGTPFDATFIQEEDIIKICIWLGHTHPKGVLQYSAVKLVVLFHSADKMLVMACGIIKATTLCKESIKVRTSPPSATHVRTYMVVVNGEPSGGQPPTPDREEEPQLSPSEPHLGGRTPCQLQMNLGDLADNKLWQHHGGSPQGGHSQGTKHKHPPLAPWGNPVGNGNPNVDDKEVTFLRWEGGNPQDNHSDLLLPLNQMRM